MKPGKVATPGKASSPGQVRIIGGQWKKSLLPVIAQEGLRPTPSRVRETLFNWLGQDLTGLACVDAFAGTGALGFEAASRGAKSVLLIEHNPELTQALERLRTKLSATNLRIQCTDAIAGLNQLPSHSQDVIFLDPPFAQTALFAPSLKAAARTIKPSGHIYLETAKSWDAEELAQLGLAVVKQGRAGVVYFYLLNQSGK
jgi:16S rRNA (guanine(966)-N(2))-methyltransferase RsmD